MLNLVKYASRFQLVMGLQEGYTVVDYCVGDAGLYLRNFRNDFGTNLAVRGSRMEIEALIAELTN